MRKTLLAFIAAALSLLGTSCEKNELQSTTPDREGPVFSARGEIGSDEGDACLQPVTTRLIIEKNGQNNSYTDWVGNVTVTNDADSITVRFDCIDGNVLKEVRVWAGAYANAPVNKPGMPEFGHFMAANNNIPNLTSYTIKIPTSSIGAGNTGVIVAHANTYKHNTESAWGEGPQFVAPGGKALYFNYTACSGSAQ